MTLGGGTGRAVQMMFLRYFFTTVVFVRIACEVGAQGMLYVACTQCVGRQKR